MPRLLSLLPALVVAAVLTGVAPASTADPGADPAPDRTSTRTVPTATPADENQDPLALTISALDPATLPDKGPVTVRGTITNTSEETWTAINVYAFMGTDAITTSAQLAEQLKVDETVDVGDRITDPGTYDHFDQLAPGQQMPYRMTVPRSSLPAVTVPGVYWFGVHALGQGTAGRVTAGRARTFLPYVPDGTGGQEDVAMVLPLRHHVVYAADGSVKNPADWARDVSRGGSLDTLVDVGRRSGSVPLTWLIDPAVPDTVRHLVTGNQPISLAASDADDSTKTATPNAATRVGAVWLRRLHSALETSGEILALPYGDTDVPAAARHDLGVYRLARERSGSTLAPWGLSMRPAVASPTGMINARTLRALPADTTVLASDRLLFAEDRPGETVAPTVGDVAGRRVVFAASSVLDGGPAPGDPQGQIALRQRMVSEAALRLLDGGQPLVVALPGSWTHALGRGFFRADAPWLHFTTLSDVAAGPATTMKAGELHYPRLQAARELPVSAFVAARELVDAGSRLGSVITGNDTVAARSLEAALAGPSYASRIHPGAAVTRLLAARTNLDAQLDKIRIEAPRGVTLSSRSGEFSVILVNGLDQPVTVRLQAQSTPPMKITGPDVIELPPGARSTARLEATARTLGVHNVTIQVTDSQGRAIGAQDVLPIRAAQVSAVIWLVIGLGLAVLFAAIVVRLVRRVRAARRTRSDPTVPEPSDHEAVV